MPRIRTIKPEFFGSPDTAKASFKARLLYIAMWCWADDYGVGLTNLQSLAGFAFEHDDTSASEVQSLLSEVQGSFGVVFYTVGGRYYYAIPSWDDHQKTQRKAARRNPGPDHPEACPDQRFNDLQGTSEWTQGTSAHPQGDVDPGKGKGKGKGTGEQPSSSAKPPAVAKPPREDVEQLCIRLREHVARNTDKPPTITARWRTEARLLLDKDGIEFDEAVRVLDWCQQDSFWMPNILSMPKFREKFAQLQIKSRQSSERGNTHDAWSTPKGYDPADWLRKPDEPSFDYIDAEVVQLREIGR